MKTQFAAVLVALVLGAGIAACEKKPEPQAEQPSGAAKNADEMSPADKLKEAGHDAASAVKEAGHDAANAVREAAGKPKEPDQNSKEPPPPAN